MLPLTLVRVFPAYRSGIRHRRAVAAERRKGDAEPHRQSADERRVWSVIPVRRRGSVPRAIDGSVHAPLPRTIRASCAPIIITSEAARTMLAVVGTHGIRERRGMRKE